MHLFVIIKETPGLPATYHSSPLWCMLCVTTELFSKIRELDHITPVLLTP